MKLNEILQQIVILKVKLGDDIGSFLEKVCAIVTQIIFFFSCSDFK